MPSLDNFNEANYVCGILNANDVVDVIDGYAISTNGGIDVLKYLAIPKYDPKNDNHNKIARLSEIIHLEMRKAPPPSIKQLEAELNKVVRKLFL